VRPDKQRARENGVCDRTGDVCNHTRQQRRRDESQMIAVAISGGCEQNGDAGVRRRGKASGCGPSWTKNLPAGTPTAVVAGKPWRRRIPQTGRCGVEEEHRASDYAGGRARRRRDRREGGGGAADVDGSEGDCGRWVIAGADASSSSSSVSASESGSWPRALRARWRA
jgi:hypothetical protein